MFLKYIDPCHMLVARKYKMYEKVLLLYCKNKNILASGTDVA